MSRVFNFSAGPAVLPEPVLHQLQEDLMSHRGIGMSVMEISHRSSWADDIFSEAEANLRQLLGVADSQRVLFLQGGAQLQFSMIPMNYLRAEGSADYILTGSWGAKAFKEAVREGHAQIAWDGKVDRYSRAPDDAELDLDAGAAYAYYTSNETIQGVQFQREPSVGGTPLVCDASSDFLSRPLDMSRYDLLYACAQKNAGPAGLTVVIVSDRLLERGKPNLHSMLDYRQHAEAGSRLNTPPMFAIYVFLLITRWLADRGGLGGVERLNQRKAARLYEVIDQSDGFYACHAAPGSRSMMNVVFRLASEDLDREFLAGAGKLGMQQLKGHRSVGGIRASIYNAMPEAGVEALREYMVEFRNSHR